MSVSELLQKAQYMVDAEGRKTAVVFDYALWDELLTLLEDLEDAQELQELDSSDDEIILWEQAKAELRAKDIDI